MRPRTARTGSLGDAGAVSPLSPRWPSGWLAGEDPCPGALLTKLGMALTWAAPGIPVNPRRTVCAIALGSSRSF